MNFFRLMIYLTYNLSSKLSFILFKNPENERLSRAPKAAEPKAATLKAPAAFGDAAGDRDR